MKRIAFFLLLVGGAALLSACSETKANSETEFWVRGNCDMCKETIETSLEAVEGVAEASYDLAANTATISFDSAATNPAALQQAVANAGYETKEMQADEAAYADLPKCCKKKEDR